MGLGNPGPKYQNTRHNIGFDWVDAAVGQLFGHDLKFSSKFDSLYCVGRLGEAEVHFLKPQTYMNLSGGAVRKWRKKFQGDVRFLVVLDDVDLALGRLRLRWTGRDAGHRGMRSICDNLGTQDVPRLRIGVGRPTDETRDYVLEKFDPDEKKTVQDLLAVAGEHLTAFVEKQPDEALNIINGFRGGMA